MRIKDLLRMPTVRTILYLRDNGEVRYAELTRLIRSRGTLSLVLRELEADGLVKRKAIATKPISVTYSLNELGREIASSLSMIRDAIGKSQD